MHDPHPQSSFSPLPPAFQFGRKNKEQALVGQRAELDHILEPGFKAASIYDGDDNTSIAGPSRLSSARTAGGLSALSRKSKDEGLRPSGSITSFHPNRDSAVSRRGLGGVYIDSSGRLHDTEYDPFAGVSEMSRRKSRRRSAFGGQQRRGSLSASDGSDVSSDSGRLAAPRTSYDGRRVSEEEKDKERDEIRRRLEVDRRRLDEVSGYAAARRRSMVSDRASGYHTINGRATPSIRSGHEDGISLAPNGRVPSRLSQHATLPSPRSPTFDGGISTLSGSSYATTRQSARPASSNGGGEESPRKHTETTPPELAKRELPNIKSKREEPPPTPLQQDYEEDDDDEEVYEETTQDTDTETPVTTAPLSPVMSAVKIPSIPSAHPAAAVPVIPLVLTPEPPEKDKPPPPYHEQHDNDTVVTTIRSARVPSKTLPKPPPKPKLSVPKQKVETAPDGATRVTGFAAGPPRAAVKPQTVASRTIKVPESVMSHNSSRSSEREHRKPAERPREQIFPETPAQAKRREEQERRHLRAGRTPAGALAADSVAASSRSRILPEIEIVDDDDPRIVFPSAGPRTRIQSHDHIIRSSSSIGRDNSSKSIKYNDSNKATSAIIEETGGGYVPSRWAQGDRNLRVTGEQKEMYRPKEWGGKHGDLGGRAEEWR